MRLGYFTMPLHPLNRDPIVTLQEDREAIILADKLGFHDAFVGEHLTDSAENVTNSFIFLATLISETSSILLGTGTSNLDSFHLNGWNASLSGYFNRYIGVTGDFGGIYGTPEFLGIPIHTKYHTFMFGPTLRLPNPTRLTPFVHALGGAAHLSGGSSGLSVSETDAAWAVGGGVDLKIAPLLGVRLGQVDYLQIRSNGTNLNNIRYSGGVVLRF